MFLAFKFLFLIFSLSFSKYCNEKTEVNLWNQCYDINSTIELNLSGVGLSGNSLLYTSDAADE